MDTASIEAGFDRIVDQQEEMDQQTNQLNASTRKTGTILSSLTKVFGVLGAVGVGAITALATKSPVLAGTMAKIEVQTLKLSNTIGRQLRPIFETIAGDLLPALNKAFADNKDSIGIMVNNISLLIKSLSNLISLDFSGLLTNLDRLFKPEGLGDVTPADVIKTIQSAGSGGVYDPSDPFAETKQRARNIFDTQTPFGEGPKSKNQFVNAKNIGALGINILIDFFQWISNQNDNKNMAMTTADGISR